MNKWKALAAGAAVVGLGVAGGVVAAAGPALAADGPGPAGAVYTMTNSPAGNAIEAYARAGDGSLTPAGTYPTGGDGGALGSGHSIAVSRDGRVVVNVNAGSNSVSAFAATARGLRLIGTASSGGTDPNSVTIAADDLVYVLNAGSETIAGLRLGDRGLRPVQGSVRPLGAGALVPRQIQFSTDGRVLVVDEGGSSTIDTFVVGPDGAAGPAITTPSTGGGPFGFDVDRAGYLLVSDAALTTGHSGATSYDVARDGTVTANGPAVPTDQAAACWLAAAGSYAYTDNAGSGSIGEFAVAPDGALTLLGNQLVENNAASHPLDEAVSADQHYLYILANGLSQIVGYRVGRDGSLTQVTTAPIPPAPAGSAPTETLDSRNPRGRREAKVFTPPTAINSGAPLPACVAAQAWDPPRYCPQCGRRMVVQGHPAGVAGSLRETRETDLPGARRVLADLMVSAYDGRCVCAPRIVRPGGTLRALYGGRPGAGDQPRVRRELHRSTRALRDDRRGCPACSLRR